VEFAVDRPEIALLPPPPLDSWYRFASFGFTGRLSRDLTNHAPALRQRSDAARVERAFAMDAEFLLAILFRWAHVLAVVAAVGGLFFLRVVLYPAVREALGDEQRAMLREKVLGRWRRVSLICIALLLISGIYNFVTISLPKAEDIRLYHPLFGIKFLAALGVFFLASALTSRGPAFKGLRDRTPKWLAVTCLLALAVILISGVLKNLTPASAESDSAVAVLPQTAGSPAEQAAGYDLSPALAPTPVISGLERAIAPGTAGNGSVVAAASAGDCRRPGAAAGRLTGGNIPPGCTVLGSVKGTSAVSPWAGKGSTYPTFIVGILGQKESAVDRLRVRPAA
jgi:hypothetical protein